ncbi:hypothetical protein N9O38_00870 [Flavobacteriaceae bacterium]|nr:hypothetical protein [Flavobacteriaceae bacterium]
MGGFVRRIFKTVFSQPKPVIAPVAQTVAETAPVAKEAVDVAKQKQAALGSGYGTSAQTVLAKADEAEANVQKTVLGGGKKKRIKA